jgi:hypothetical protein
MRNLIKKYAQRIANHIVFRLEIAIENDNDYEFQTLISVGLALDEWCMKKGIELECLALDEWCMKKGIELE